MEQIFSNSDLKLWDSLVEAEGAYYSARMKLFTECTSRSNLINLAKYSLCSSRSEFTAFRVIALFTTEEKEQLFNELIGAASTGHSDIEIVREIILSMPKEWLLANIEKSSEPFLSNDSYEEYRRFLELYYEIDNNLTLRLAQRAINSSNSDIREAGEDFIRRLNISNIDIENEDHS
jgi:hypothetical protein